MFCLITFGMMATAVSVAELPCSDFALGEPKQQVARRPPTLETKAEPKPSMQLAALAPDTRLLDESDQPASKGYIMMYANSPTLWTPVPLPDEISATNAPHNNNIRAEIERAAMLFNVDMRIMKTFAKIESGYNPRAK